MIKLLMMDVDGTLTDGKIYIGNNGELMKAFNVKDGFGLANLKDNGIIPVIVTGRASKIVDIRANELGITEVYQNVKDKNEILNKILLKFNLSNDEIGYIGDDINDFNVMNKCGFKACPTNAIDNVRNICNYVSPYCSGDGAVRDIIDYILNMNK